MCFPPFLTNHDYHLQPIHPHVSAPQLTTPQLHQPTPKPITYTKALNPSTTMPPTTPIIFTLFNYLALLTFTSITMELLLIRQYPTTFNMETNGRIALRALFMVLYIYLLWLLYMVPFRFAFRGSSWKQLWDMVSGRRMENVDVGVVRDEWRNGRVGWVRGGV